MLVKRALGATIPALAGTLALAGLATAGMDDTAPPTPATGVTATVLGSGMSAVAPDRVLLVQQRTFAPGADSGDHPAPGPVVVYVDSGPVDFTVVEGAASLTRAADPMTTVPAGVEQIPAGSTVTLAAGDSVFYDEGVVHSFDNHGDADAVTLEARLNPADG